MKLKVWVWGRFRWHNIRNRFHHNQTSGSQVASCQRTNRHDQSYLRSLSAHQAKNAQIWRETAHTLSSLISEQGGQLCIQVQMYQMRFRENRWLKCWDVRLVPSLVEMSPVRMSICLPTGATGRERQIYYVCLANISLTSHHLTANCLRK